MSKAGAPVSLLPAAPPQLPLAAGWQARLTLRLAVSSGRTVLKERRHEGPLRVQRPFYPEPDGTCHVYVLHPPGGVVGGDRLAIDAALEAGARALITTPGAGKFYRSAGPRAVARQVLQVASGACLEWLPQETLLFDGARVDLSTRVELGDTARFIGWEVLCAGRPAAGETFAHGDCRQSFEVWRHGRPLWVERARLAGGAAMLTAPWGMAGYPVTATLVAVGHAPRAVSAARELVSVSADEHCTVSQLQEVIVCRYLGHHAVRARELLARVWSLLRPDLMGRQACAPRIWRT
jgi:urease accessory protein